MGSLNRIRRKLSIRILRRSWKEEVKHHEKIAEIFLKISLVISPSNNKLKESEILDLIKDMIVKEITEEIDDI